LTRERRKKRGGKLRKYSLPQIKRKEESHLLSRRRGKRNGKGGCKGTISCSRSVEEVRRKKESEGHSHLFIYYPLISLNNNRGKMVIVTFEGGGMTLFYSTELLPEGRGRGERGWDEPPLLAPAGEKGKRLYFLFQLFFGEEKDMKLPYPRDLRKKGEERPSIE